MSEGAGAAGRLHRLHPLSPLLRSAKTLTIIVAAISWQGFSQLGPVRWVALVGALLLATVLLSAVGWLVTGYQIVGRELRIHDGVLWRRTRAIPLERLQAVELVRPLLAQLTGLAELRLEVIGGSKAEAPLAYLGRGEATALRQRLLTLAGHTTAGAAGTAPAPATAPVGSGNGRHIHAVDNRDVLLGQLLTPQAWSVPLAVALVITQTVFKGSWTFVGIASTITALAGVVLQPLRRVLADWNFRLSRDGAGLRLRHGLTETRSQTVPLQRTQAIGVTWPLLWRMKGWLRMRIDVAGYSPGDGGLGQRSDVLMPVGDQATAARILAEVLSGVNLDALPLTQPPRRARWLAPLRQRVLGTGLTDEVFVTRDGVLTRELIIVPYARLQSVRVIQGPLQRALRLATVHADTAGGLHAVAEERDVAEAWWLAAELVTRSRAARARVARLSATELPSA